MESVEFGLVDRFLVTPESAKIGVFIRILESAFNTQ